jgi:hypothetical protein
MEVSRAVRRCPRRTLNWLNIEDPHTERTPCAVFRTARRTSISLGAALRWAALEGLHIAMRLQHAKQAASGLSTDTPGRMQAKAVIVPEVEGLHWRIWNGKAKNAQRTLERVRKVMHVFQGERSHRAMAVQTVARAARGRQLSAWLKHAARQLCQTIPSRPARRDIDERGAPPTSWSIG